MALLIVYDSSLLMVGGPAVIGSLGLHWIELAVGMRERVPAIVHGKRYIVQMKFHVSIYALILEYTRHTLPRIAG